MVQRLAHRALQDGVAHTDIVHLASLGNSGLQPQNAQRDLLRWMQQHLDALPYPIIVEVPLKANAEDDVAIGTNMPLLPLHRLLAYMWVHWPQEFEARVSGGPGAVTEFWGSVSGLDPRWQSWQPWLTPRRDFKEKCIPFALHGDGVPVFKGKSLNVISANSILGAGSTLDFKFYITSYWSALRSKAEGNDTEDKLWEHILWDLNALWTGVHPSTGPSGAPWLPGSEESCLALQPLCGGYYGIPWLFKADLEYLALYLKLNHFQSLKPCVFCKADTGEHCWTDFRPGALWKSTVWGWAEWRAAHPQCHRLFTFLGCTVHTVHCDVLHTVSLGVAQHVVGNVLFILIWQVLDKTKLTGNQRLAAVWHDIREFYTVAKAPVRIRKLKWSMFLPDPRAPRQHYPHMNTKGKETEWLARAVHWLWEHYADIDDAMHGHITCVLKYLIELYDHCSTPGLFFTPEEAATVKQCTAHLQLHYSWLARDAIEKGLKLWNIVPKLHYLWHIGQQAAFLHPRAGWTYPDEDFVGRIAKLARASTGGIAIDRLGNTIVAKYRRGLYFRWAGRLPKSEPMPDC